MQCVSTDVLRFALIVSLLLASSILCKEIELPDAIKLDPYNLGSIISKYDVVFLLLYSPRCGHCHNMAPEFNALAIKYKQQFLARKVIVCALDGSQPSDIQSFHKIRGFPTMLLFEGGRLVEEYQGARTASAMADFISSRTSSHKDL